MVKERRAKTVGRAVGAAKRVRVVAGRRRKEANSLEAIVAGVGVVVVKNGLRRNWCRFGSLEGRSPGGLCATIVRSWNITQGV